MTANLGNEVTMLDVAIIGAGFSGMYMLHQARDKLKLNTRVFEAGDGDRKSVV